MDSEAKNDKWFTGRMGFMIQLGTVVVGITVVILQQSGETDKLRLELTHIQDKTSEIQSEINVLNTNHLTHIQASMSDMAVSMARISQKLEDHIAE